MRQDESSIPWQYTKGMTLSYAALATALINFEIITAEELIKELDVFINSFTEHYPDSIAIIETIKMVKDTILKLYPANAISREPTFAWISDFIGNA